MGKRKVAGWTLVTALAAGAVVVGTSTSQADIIVNPGTPYEYVLGPGGQVKVPPTATKPASVTQPVDPADPRVKGVLVNGTYTVTWTVTNPENRSDVVSGSGNITLSVDKLTTDFRGDTYGDGTATGDLGEGPVTGTVKAKVTKDGVLDTVLVNVDNGPGMQPFTLYYGFGDLRCKSCVTVKDGVLTDFKQTFVRRVPRTDGKGLRASLGTFTAVRVAS